MVWWVLVEPPQQVSLVVAPPGNQKVSGQTCRVGKKDTKITRVAYVKNGFTIFIG